LLTQTLAVVYGNFSLSEFLKDPSFRDKITYRLKPAKQRSVGLTKKVSESKLDGLWILPAGVQEVAFDVIHNNLSFVTYSQHAS
jgi:hypothetical protein